MSGENREKFNQLVRRCLKGDEDAWEEVVDVITPIVFAVCRQRRLSYQESLDIFGQVCYLMLNNLPKLRSPEKILAYVATTTRWEIFAMLRRARLFEEINQAEFSGVSGHEQKSPDRIAEDAERVGVLMTALQRLSEKESKLVYHLFLDEKEPSYEEISSCLGMPISSIGATRARCLKKLKRILKSMSYHF